MGAAVEINTGAIGPQHLKGKRVMLGSHEIGVFDGSSGMMRFDIPSGRHVLYLKEGMSTSGAIAFKVQSGHCAQITMKDTEPGMFAAFFGGWFSLERAGDARLPADVPGAEEIPKDEVPADD